MNGGGRSGAPMCMGGGEGSCVGGCSCVVAVVARLKKNQLESLFSPEENCFLTLLFSMQCILM
jgi:hypothetical protein